MKKKILIGLCIFLVMILVGGYVFLRSSFFTGKLRLAMESVLQKQLGRKVSVGKVTGNVFGNISIAGISIAKDKELRDGRFAEIEEVTAGYSLLSLLRWKFVIDSLRVARPRIWLERDEEGKLNLPKIVAARDKEKRSWFSVLVSNIDMFSGEITFDDRKNSIHSAFSGINGKLRGIGREMEYSGKIRVQKIDLKVRGISKTIFNLASSFETSGERLRLSDLQFQLGRSHLQAKGEITGWDKRIPYESPQVSAEVRSRFFLEDINEFLLPEQTQDLRSNEVEDSRPRLDGVAEIYGLVSGEIPDLNGICRVDLPIMRVDDLQIQNVNAEVRFAQSKSEGQETGEQGSEEARGRGGDHSFPRSHAPMLPHPLCYSVPFDVSADLTGGSAKLKGAIQLADGKMSKYDGVLRLDHLDIGEIMTGLKGRDEPGTYAPISGRLSGEVSVSGKQLRPGSIWAEGQFSVLDARFPTLDSRHPASSIQYPAPSIKASLSVEGESIALNVSRSKTAIGLEGKLDDDGELDLSMGIDRFDAGEVTSLLTGSPSIIGEGCISANIGMKIVDPGFRAGMGLPPVEEESTGEKGRKGESRGARRPESRLSGFPAFRSAPLHPLLPGIADLRAQVNVDMPDLRLPVGMKKTQDMRQEEETPSLESVGIGSLTGTINLIDDRLRVDEIALQSGESKCLLAAEVQIKDPPLVNARLTVDSLKIQDYLSLVGGGRTQVSGEHTGSPPQISGGLVSGGLTVHGETTDMSGRGGFSVTGLAVGHRDIDPISVPIEIESSILTVPSLVVSSAGERVTADLDLSPSGDYNLQVDSSPIDLSKLIPLITGKDASAASIGGTAQVSLSGSGKAGARHASPIGSLEGKLQLKHLVYKGEDFGNGECVFALRDEKLHADVSLLEQTLIATLDGSVQHPFPFKAIIQLGNINLEPALNIVGLGEKIDLRIAGSIDVDGEGANPLDSSVDAICQTVLLDAEGRRWTNDTAIEFGFDDGEFRVSQAKMKGAGGQLSAKGRFDIAGPIDVDVAVKNLDLAAISGLLDLPEPVIGRMDCMLRIDGGVSSPSIAMALDASGLSYQHVDVDDISVRASYKNGMMEVERSVFNVFDGEVRLSAMLPLADLDLRNLTSPERKAGGEEQEAANSKPYALDSMLYALRSMPIYVFLNAEDLNLSFIPAFAPQLLTAGGKVDDVHLEMTGSIMQPKIGGSLKLKDVYFQSESLPVPIENLNGDLSIRSKEQEPVTCDALRVTDYEASLKLTWDMEKGRYDAGFSMLDTGCWILDAWHRVLGVEDQALSSNEAKESSMEYRASSIESRESRSGQPYFRFDLQIQDGQLGSLVKEMTKSSPLPVDGRFSGRLHLESKEQGASGRGDEGASTRLHASSLTRSLLPMLYNLRGGLTIDSLDLAVNGHKIKDHRQIEVSFADGTLEVPSLRLLALAPPLEGVEATHPSAVQVGSISVSGKISMDETFELNLSGEHLHPGLFPFSSYKPMGSYAREPISPILSGDLAFDIHARGNLDSPEIALYLAAKDLTLDVRQETGDRRQESLKSQVSIDRILCKTSYSDEILNVEEIHIDTSDNSLDINGTLPIGISLLPAEVRLLDQGMDLRMLINNFNLAILDHLSDEIEGVKGNVEADVRMLGSLKDPRLTGRFQISDASCRLMVEPMRTLAQTDISIEPKPIEIENIGLNVTMGTGESSIQHSASSIQCNMAFQIGEGQYEAHGKIGMGKGLEPQLFDVAFKAAPVEIDPFLHLVSQDAQPLTSLVSGEIMVDGQLKGDVREMRDKPILDALRAVSGEVSISDEGIKIDAAGRMITNPKRIYAKLQHGKLDLPSMKLIHKIPGDGPSSSIAAFGFWEIGGDESFDAIVDLDMSLVSELISQSRPTIQPGFMNGWLRFKVQTRGQEVQCLWSPASVGATHASPPHRSFTVGHAIINRFEGKVIYKEHEIYVEQAHISSGANHVIFSGSVPVSVKRETSNVKRNRMALRVDAQLDDMGILSFLSKDITESSGTGIFGATITGDVKKVMAQEETIRFVGFCSFSDLDVNFDRSYIKFEGLEADIEFDSEKLGVNRGFIELKALRGKMNDGEFALDVKQLHTGKDARSPGAELIWEKGKGYRIGELRDISVTMKGCELYWPMIYSISFDSKLSLMGKFDAPIIRGSVTINKGEYTESLEDFIQRLFSSREIGFRAFLDYPLVQDLELDVNVQVPGNVRMDNSLVMAETKAAARVRGSLSDPVVLAQAYIIEGSKFRYFGREFTITKGEIRNRSTIDPEYDITAQTEITNTGDLNTDAKTLIVQMQLKGSLNEPLPPVFTTLGSGLTRSSSSLSQKDIIAILTLGSTPEEFRDKALSGPSPLLMEPAKWYFEAKAEELLDLKEFQIQRDTNVSKETRLVIAKQLQLIKEISLTADVGYLAGSIGSVEQRVGLQYEMSKHFAIAVEANQEGDWDFDLKIKRDFP